jgi:hypothetical protein
VNFVRQAQVLEWLGVVKILENMLASLKGRSGGRYGFWQCSSALAICLLTSGRKEVTWSSQDTREYASESERMLRWPIWVLAVLLCSGYLFIDFWWCSEIRKIMVAACLYSERWDLFASGCAGSEQSFSWLVQSDIVLLVLMLLLDSDFGSPALCCLLAVLRCSGYLFIGL